LIIEAETSGKDIVNIASLAAWRTNVKIEPNSVFWFYFFYGGTRGSEGRV
jgi:hypothetical protein